MKILFLKNAALGIWSTEPWVSLLVLWLRGFVMFNKLPSGISFFGGCNQLIFVTMTIMVLWTSILIQLYFVCFVLFLSSLQSSEKSTLMRSLCITLWFFAPHQARQKRDCMWFPLREVYRNEMTLDTVVRLLDRRQGVQGTRGCFFFFFKLAQHKGVPIWLSW